MKKSHTLQKRMGLFLLNDIPPSFWVYGHFADCDAFSIPFREPIPYPTNYLKSKFLGKSLHAYFHKFENMCNFAPERC